MLAKENNDRSLRIKNVDFEFESAESAHKSTMQELTSRITEEDSRGNKLRVTVDSMQKLIDESNRIERELNSQYQESVMELERLQSEIKSAKQEKEEIAEQLGFLNTKLKQGVSINDVVPLLCQSCKRKVDPSNADRLVAGP
mmetsp:Transcript_32251/g.55751  ORF Transcript_32251/g.55751 Transcript_32251/m.55751 type:complete len:142 (+) Transcript_32251:351-776(+)